MGFKIITTTNNRNSCQKWSYNTQHLTPFLGEDTKIGRQGAKQKPPPYTPSRHKGKGERASQSWLRNHEAENVEAIGFPVRPEICFHDRYLSSSPSSWGISPQLLAHPLSPQASVTRFPVLWVEQSLFSSFSVVVHWYHIQGLFHWPTTVGQKIVLFILFWGRLIMKSRMTLNTDLLTLPPKCWEYSHMS